MIRPGPETCCNLLELYADHNEESYMMSILGRMRAESIPPYLATFERMLRMYVRLGDCFGMEDLLKSMRATYVPPDVNAYNAVIEGYAKAKRLHDALNTLQHFVFEEDIRPNPATLVTILHACKLRERCAMLHF